MARRDDVDELFGAAGAQATPRTGLVVTLLATGLLLALAGLACSSAPGGLVVLGAHAVADKDVQRLESGYLPADAAPLVRALQRATVVALVFVMLIFLVQSILLCSGFYDLVWGDAVDRLLGGEGAPVGPVLPSPTPTVPPS